MVANRAARIALVALQTLMGLVAVVSGPALIATDGLGMPPGWMEASPFGSYAIPGLVLMIVGLVNLTGAVAVWRSLPWGGAASAVAGLLWVGWFVVQVAVIGFVSWQQPFYFVVGILILTLATPSLAGWLRATKPLPRRPGPA